MSEETQPVPTPDDPGPMAAAPGSSMSGEQMASIGGALLVGSYLVFGLVFNEYWISWLPLVLAVFAVVIPRMDQEFVEKIAKPAVLMKVIGYTLGIIGLLTIIEDLRFFDSALDDALEIVGALVAYAGFVLAFLGARSIKT